MSRLWLEPRSLLVDIGGGGNISVIDAHLEINKRVAVGGVVVQATRSSKAPEVIQTDPVRFRQILLNLVNNAVKFTPEKGMVALTAERADDRIRFTIEDTGIGIAEADIERLAKPFVQVENQFTKSHKGSGLGLAIARSLIELHGGELEIASEVSKGTAVSFTLAASSTTVPAQAELL